MTSWESRNKRSGTEFHRWNVWRRHGCSDHCSSFYETVFMCFI